MAPHLKRKGHCCGENDHNHDHSHDHHSHDHHSHDHHDSHYSHAHTHDTHPRGYDKPLIDGVDDDSSCACAHHPEDAVSKKTVAEMVAALDEVIALSSGPVYTDFISNATLHNRLTDLLEQVQNDALSLPADYKQRKSKADWDFLETLKEQIVHSEFGMNPETLWDVVRLEIPYQHKMLGIIINGCSHEQ